MLAKVAPPSNDFHALARYLVEGKSRNPDPRRVAWVFSRNLPTDDPLTAAIYMTATAEKSRRVRNAAYHLMIAWHEGERPTPEAMQRIAKQTLELAGLAEHQALIMGHGDRPHPHLHILLNRAHPETGRAWKTSQDFARFDRIMQQLAEVHGFAFVPSHMFNPEPTDDLAKLPNSPATYAAKRGAATDRPQWSKQDARSFGSELSEGIDHAATIDDVESFLADRGLTLEAKGQGFVIGDATAYAKLSSLRLTCSARSFELLRVTAVQTQARRSRFILSVDAVDIARAFHAFGLLTKDDVRQAVDDAKTERAQNRQQRQSKRPDPWSSTALRSPLVAKVRKVTLDDPLVAAFRVIEGGAATACARLDRLIVRADGKVKEFYVAARDVQSRFASIAKDAADAVERAELLVSRRDR